MIEFGQPAALWTGLAVGLPILAHMAYRRITERHAFPSLRFITPSQIPRTGRKTPTDLPLLLLRILLFLAIMFLSVIVECIYTFFYKGISLIIIFSMKNCQRQYYSKRTNVFEQMVYYSYNFIRYEKYLGTLRRQD